MGELTKAIEAFNKPICKLIDAIKDGIGVTYEPNHLKKMADAQSYAIEKIGEAIRNNSDLPIAYMGKTTELNIDISDANSLVERTKQRFLFHETRKQQNLDAIATKTYMQLENKTECSSDPIDQDWMTRFLSAAQDVSDDDLQNLWAKILAGEIIKPKSCSFRTIETLKNMSKDEFDIFLKICPFICGEFISEEGNLLGKYGITYGMILSLDECGLINSGVLISRDNIIKKNSVIFSTNKYTLVGTTKTNNYFKTSITVYPLTESGKKLYSLSECDINEGYLFEYIQALNKRYPNVVFNLYDNFTKEIINFRNSTDSK